MPTSRFRLLDLLIDIPQQRVERDGMALEIGGLSFQLLAYLLAQGDRVVSFDDLITAVWAPAVVNEETVTQRIKLLRQALGDDGRNPRYVRSVRGRGYQLCALPQAVDAPPETLPIQPRSWRKPVAIMVALLFVVVVALLFFLRTPPPEIVAAAAPDIVSRAAYYASIGQRENNERAILLYQQALAATPENIAAKLGLSRAYSARVCLYNANAEWAMRAQELAEQVLKNSPNHAKAWADLAYAHDCMGRIDDAVHAYERAFALDSSDDASRSSAAYLYQEKGRLADALQTNLDMHGDSSRVRFREVQLAREFELLGFAAVAQAHYQRIYQLNPDNIFSNIAWPRFLFLQGRFAEAQAVLDQSLARNTERVDLYLLNGELALVRGDQASAARAFEQAARLRPQTSYPATLAALYTDPAPPAAWLAQRVVEVRASTNSAQAWPSDQLELVLLELAAGDQSAALATLEKAVVAGYSDKAYLQTSPLFHALTGSPGFASVIDTISRHIDAERQRVLAASWCPPEIRATP
ncbi:tetratricopeptide repeat protein [Pseudolysobacter antarcticus]|uniref:Tetratricopeptide repeat protein n=1 Tax=Pseudolysobacter antarcticus TaxID=2511995 RepID=A0A411HPF9_9GAMM|nr:winged helix-turn-helix transcriptional regulator [Pseudolysobacter antarcticus]QBB72373.1 tetratricopeptide repeat protein [Pseudolysobacter antarcticus]